VVTRVPKSTDAEMEAAVNAADNAFKTWSKTSILTRQQTMFKLQALIKQNLVGFPVIGVLFELIINELFDRND
jgi:acyl-CoA reductase-like NAD-dependent aldehyde dehydrogenase